MRPLPLSQALALLAALILPCAAEAAPTWQKVVTGGGSNNISCTKIVSTGYFLTVSPVAMTVFYTMYGSGGGGGSVSANHSGSGGGGSSAIIIGGALVSSANGGAGGNGGAVGQNGNYSSNADGAALTVAAGQTIIVCRWWRGW